MNEQNGTAISEADRHIIERPRLTRLLDETSARVIILVAPAGYGKTTLARQWLAQRPHVWLQANSASADVAALVVQVGASLSNFGGITQDHVREPSTSADDLSQLLGDAVALQLRHLKHWPPDAWFAIDEYELIASSRPSSDYIQQLLHESRLNLLVTSRIRPEWATPRKQLYGDVLLLDQTSLAMNDAEARELLGRRSQDDIRGVVRSAAGWPAVLGLAALTTRPSNATLPHMLYEYFAEELFAQASPQLRQALIHLAAVARLTPAVAAVVMGPRRSGRLLAEASDLGFLAGESEPRLHPLLRSFLLSKRESSRNDSASMKRVVSYLLSEEEWDEAFEVIRNTSQTDALVDLLEGAHTSLLKSGRTTTLLEWLEFADAHRVQSPLLNLIRAELAIRQGSVGHAEQLALQVAEREPMLSARAFCIAGRAAHLDNRGKESVQHFHAAARLAKTDDDHRQAAWGALLTAQDLERDTELRAVFDRFLTYGSGTADDAIRSANAQLAVALSTTGLTGVLQPALTALRTYQDAADPVVVASLLNSLSRSLSLTLRYSEALALAEEELELCNEAGLEFVVPYAHAARGAALMGLRKYGKAEDSLLLAAVSADDLGDKHNIFDVAALHARSVLAQRQIDRAVQLTDREPDPDDVSSGMYAEYVATRGLAFACAGDIDRARELFAAANATSSIPEAVALVSCGSALLVLSDCATGGATESTLDELQPAFELSILDPVLISQRANPNFADVLRDARDRLPRRLVTALSKQDGPPDEDTRWSDLTPREREVLGFLARGFTNRDCRSSRDR